MGYIILSSRMDNNSAVIHINTVDSSIDIVPGTQSSTQSRLEAEGGLQVQVSQAFMNGK